MWFVTVIVPASCAPMVHTLFEYTLYATVPPAVVLAFVSVELAKTELPAATLLLESPIEIPGANCAPGTVSTSVPQVLVAAALTASPE